MRLFGFLILTGFCLFGAHLPAQDAPVGYQQSDLNKRWIEVGNDLVEKGRLAEAASCFQHVIKLDPQSAAARKGLQNVEAAQRIKKANPEQRILYPTLPPKNPGSLGSVALDSIYPAGSVKRPSFEQRLNRNTPWDMANGEQLWLLPGDSGIKLVDGRANVVVQIASPLAVCESVVSRDTSCLLLRIKRQRSGGSSDYSHLVRVTRKPQSNWHAQSVFGPDTQPVNEFERWIAQIGAISNTGRMALLKLGDINQLTSRLTYRWETWLLDPPRKIADGIRTPADFDAP